MGSTMLCQERSSELICFVESVYFNLFNTRIKHLQKHVDLVVKFIIVLEAIESMDLWRLS